MYYIYLNDRHNQLFVTDIRRANRIPLFSSPFLLDSVRRLSKLEKSFGLRQGTSDLTDVYEALQQISAINEAPEILEESDYELS